MQLRVAHIYIHIYIYHHTFFRRRGHLFFALPVVARMHCTAALVLRAPRAAALRVILVFLRAAGLEKSTTQTNVGSGGL